MALPRDQLVGRVAEVASIDDALASVAHGRFTALELVGEPGIGKTRLLAELAARADARGYLTLAGSASALEHELPFWVFVDALDEYVHGLDPRRLAALGEPLLGELAPVLPSLAEREGDEATGAGARYRAHRAVRGLLEGLAAPKPLVLLLDDLHSADSGSIDLLAALFRRPPAAAVLLGLAARPRQLPERLAGALERADADGLATRLELHALTGKEARELLGDTADADRLFAASGGNPFYLQQLARVAPRGPARAGDADGAGLTGLGVPRAVAAALLDELALLRDATRRVLEGAAVAGDPFEPELAAAAAGLPEADAVDALDELLRLDLVRPTDVPRRFRFRHPLVRGAVYAAAPGGWRLRAHERTAQALAIRGAPAPARAHHVERCARQGDEDAVALLQEAALTVTDRAPLTAARLLGAALRVASPSVTAKRLELLGAQARAQMSAGRFAAAHAALLESLELVPAEDVAARLRLMSACAGAENVLGLHGQAHARLMAALEELPGRDSPDAAGLMIELAIDCFYRMEYEAMAEWAERTRTAAHGLDDRSLAASAAGMLALAGLCMGATGMTVSACDDGAALVDAMSDDELAVRIDWSLDTLAIAELHIDRYAEAAAHAERALALAQATGQGEALPVLFWVGMIRAGVGRLAEAVAVLDTAIEIARVTGFSQGLVWTLFARSLAASTAGDAEPALAAAEEAVTVAAAARERTFPALSADLALATALLEVGEAARAGEILLGADLAQVPAFRRVRWLELLTRSLLATGSHDEARRTAERAAAVARTIGTEGALTIAERTAADVALASGDPAGAASVALAAATRADTVGAVLEGAATRALAGRALTAAGDKARAIAELERAAAAFEACGAVGRRDRVERELGRLGRRPHRRSAAGRRDGDGLAALTERELQVARLIVDRRTNSEIAAELFLSPKTVESHIRHVFQKLGVSSRVEVARTVERAGRE